MTNFSNLREHTRFYHEAPIMFSHYVENPYCYYGARMYNYSAGAEQFDDVTIMAVRRMEYA